MPFNPFQQMQRPRNKWILIATSVITALVVLLGTCFIGSGFTKRTDVVLGDYSVSEDGTEITLYVGIPTSMGYIRGFEHEGGGGLKPYYLTFYSTFGGLNSSFGAKHEFTLELCEYDSEIWFNRPGGGYELVLQKDPETGAWTQPAT